jgi:hypothetical protein
VAQTEEMLGGLASAEQLIGHDIIEIDLL